MREIHEHHDVLTDIPLEPVAPMAEELTDSRRSIGNAALSLVGELEAEGIEDMRLLLGVPSEFPMQTVSVRYAPNGTIESVDMDIVIPDRATLPSTRSVGGDMVLHATWNVIGGVTINGVHMPLSRVRETLNTYDRSLNWSAIQGLNF